MSSSTPGKAARPIGTLRAPTTELRSIATLIESHHADQALQHLARFSPASDFERGWQEYLRGLAHFDKKELDLGLPELLAPYERARARPVEADSMRLAGMCLKKVGWFHRQRRNFPLAYFYHSIEHRYFEAHGSFEELHDAAISLEIDAYSIPDPHLDELWGRESIRIGEQIPDETARERALGMSWNNLAGTLSGMERFDEAEAAARESLRHWEAYEAKAGTAEFRVVWAWFGIASVLDDWAKKSPDQKGRAQEAFRESLRRAEALKMPPDDLQTIRNRLR